MRGIIPWGIGVWLTLSAAVAVNAAPIGYTITTIGLMDTEHTRSTDNARFIYAQRLNKAGQVTGYAERYNGENYIGKSAWLYDGNSTVNIGLTDAEHTSSTDNYRSSSVQVLNEAGQVTGSATRYNGATEIGKSAWLYDGSSTVNIGLTDIEHTRSTDNYRSSAAQFLNEAGQVAGYAQRYNGTAFTGQSAWLYDGSSTVNIGLTDTEHTRSTDNYRYSKAQFLNEAGQVAGYAQRYNGMAFTGQSVWLYDGSSTANIGLTDAEHTRGTDNYRSSAAQFLNEAGQVVGYAERYSSAIDIAIGKSVWLYDGSSTVNIGLTDAEHTRSTNNFRYSYAQRLNEAGQVAGYAERYNGGAYIGRSAWLYDGSSTVNIGLTDAEHTRSADNYRSSSAQFLNEAGQVAGSAERYNGATSVGISAWLYDGSSTVNIGLTDAEHTRSTDNYRYSNALFLNEAGQVAGLAYRYNGATDSGDSAWLYDGRSTMNIGLTDAEHTRSTDNYRFSSAQFLNEAGQVAGIASRYDGESSIGQSAWLYDGSTTISIDPLSVRLSDGYAFSEASYLGEDGLVLGSYTLFDALDNDLGSRAFWFTTEEGAFDLGLLVDDSFTNLDWMHLATVILANQEGFIIGSGLLNDMDAGQAAYLLTPSPVPLPASAWLLISGLGLLGARSVASQRKHSRPC